MTGTWRHCGPLPEFGELLDLEEWSREGVRTGRRIRVRVETASEQPRRPSSTQRLFAVDVPRDPPNLCMCGHLQMMHVGDGAGACTRCASYVACAEFRRLDPRVER